MKMSSTVNRRFAAALAISLALLACHAPQSADEAAIVAVMKRTWDKPDSPLVVGPIAADGDAAIADWTQGAMGGRALLRRRDSQWSVVLCAGDGIRSPAGLQLAGLAADQAQRIAARLQEQEARVAPERLAAMRSFKGIVRMDAP